jgi:hypothetical protein
MGPDRPIADRRGLFHGRGNLDADERAAVEVLVSRHIKRHGGDVEKSLAAVPAGKSTRESLAKLGVPDIEATLGHVSSAHGSTDADRTASYAVGTTASDGQPFRVLRPHARIGLGAVFVALDDEPHHEVALKQILEEHADDPTCRARFLQEAEITCGLERPGIVPVYGLGACADGRPFYAMRISRGDSLKETAEAASEAEEAMTMLQKAISVGFRAAGAFRTEDALDSLRGRNDLRLLVMDLAMPADPFATP